MKEPAPAIRVEPSWKPLLDALQGARGAGAVYVIGRVDAGKTTLCRFLIDRLKTRNARLAYLDADPGQSVIGPPATVGLTLHASRKAPRHLLRFVGATSPVGRIPEILDAVGRLSEAARKGKGGRLLVDSCGLVTGRLGEDYQVRMIRRLGPRDVVAIQAADELEPLLRRIRKPRGPRIHRLRIAAAAVTRTRVKRRQYREERFRRYFESARDTDFPLRAVRFEGFPADRSDPGAWRGRLVALADRNGFVLTLAIVVGPGAKPKTLRLYAPRFRSAGVASVHWGSLRLDRFGCELPE